MKVVNCLANRYGDWFTLRIPATSLRRRKLTRVFGLPFCEKRMIVSHFVEIRPRRDGQTDGQTVTIVGLYWEDTYYRSADVR